MATRMTYHTHILRELASHTFEAHMESRMATHTSLNHTCTHMASHTFETHMASHPQTSSSSSSCNRSSSSSSSSFFYARPSKREVPRISRRGPLKRLMQTGPRALICDAGTGPSPVVCQHRSRAPQGNHPQDTAGQTPHPFRPPTSDNEVRGF